MEPVEEAVEAEPPGRNRTKAEGLRRRFAAGLTWARLVLVEGRNPGSEGSEPKAEGHD